jgi:hypothetical protein
MQVHNLKDMIGLRLMSTMLDMLAVCLDTPGKYIMADLIITEFKENT